ncbi:MAG: ABC transporter permease [Myxococcales bacterium]|nr:ABC transporter permease [Myxococcales bacterium]
MTTLISDTLAILRREAIRYRRDRAYWVGQVVFPLAFVGFMGFGLNDVVKLPSGTDYAGHLASGLLALLVGSGAVGGGFSLIEDRQTGFLRALLIAPVARASIVLGKLVARISVSLLLVLLLVACMSTFTELRIVSLPALVTAIAGVTTVFVAIGIALGSRLRRLESFRTIAALVTVPLYLFSGIFYPIETLPAGMRALAYANPLTYGVELMRFGLLGVNEIPVATCAAMMGGLGLLAALFAVWIFDRGERAGA